MQQQQKKPRANSASSYATYDQYFGALRQLASEYGDVPSDSFWSAWTRASMSTNPFINNSRVKHISSFPADVTKPQIVEMLKAPEDNEQALRETAAGLEWGAFPFRKIRMTYQGVNTYHYYHYPASLTKEDAKSDMLRREGALLDKFNRRFQPDALAHQIVGQAWQMGKVAYYPRYSLDKPHNRVNFAFAQQLPSDWIKIVGFNSESKYTVMFNMMYLLQPGSDWRQFGDLLAPYLDDFDSVLDPFGTTGKPDGLGKKFVYASKNTVQSADGRAFRIQPDKLKANAAGNPQIYNQNGQWAYYVTLPVEDVWVFEIDDTTRAVAPMSTGLFISFDQISQIEDVALAVMQNPLVSIAFGEMPYYAERKTETSDPIKLSPTGRDYYVELWNQMIAAANAGGIAFFPAPMEKLHLETLPEATGSSDMTSKNYAYAVMKSGMSGLIPINSDPRAGAVEISAKLEEAVCFCIYRQMERMMESVYRRMGLRYEWRFTMFGGFVSDKADLENARKGLQIGMLSETLKYLALRGMSLWDDMSVSHFINESGVLDLRIPPITSYTAKQGESGLPPKAPKDPDNEGGRPTKDIDEALESGSEAQESDLDG